MLITCPECKTTYNVPSIADNPEQRVRCAKCGRVWEPATEVIDMSLLDFSLEKEAEKFSAKSNKTEKKTDERSL